MNRTLFGISIRVGILKTRPKSYFQHVYKFYYLLHVLQNIPKLVRTTAHSSCIILTGYSFSESLLLQMKLITFFHVFS